MVVHLVTSLLLLGAATIPTCSEAAAPGASFGTAHKGTWVDPSDSRAAGSWGGKPWPAHTEVQVFNHTCSCNGEAQCVCAMQHMWTGGSWAGYELTRVRYYIDGEACARHLHRTPVLCASAAASEGPRL